MKHALRNILFLTFLLTACLSGARNIRDSLNVGHVLQFSENKGQWDEDILFRTQMGSTTLWLNKEGFTFMLQDPNNAHLQHMHAPAKRPSNRFRYHVYRLQFVGSECSSVTGHYPSDSYENYYIGRDESRWASHVRLFSEVEYQGLYDGIDMRLYSSTNLLKYDFIVAPGADPSQIVMQYEGIEGMKVSNGDVILHTSVVDVVEIHPYSYQIINGQEVEVPSRFVVEKDRMRIALGTYDHDEPLIIDPYLHFSSYTGATADNWGTTGTYDSYKNTYTAGVVLDYGSGYPTSPGAYDTTFNGNADIGIFKFDTNGHNRLFATYLGGSQADMPHSMFVNAFDELVIYGTTGSANFPVSANAYDTSFNGGSSICFESAYIDFPQGSDIFVSRFSADGTQLQASTYVGGNNNDGLNYRNYYNGSLTRMMLGNDSLYFNYGDGARGELITDDLNNVYVGSTTFSFNFPTTNNAIQHYSRGGQEGIVFKLDYNLSHMIWCSYLGGSGDDAIYSIDVDSDYNLLVCGGTNSVNFTTTPGAYRTYYNGGSADGFVCKISYDGSSLMSSTLFGSSAYDQCYFVRCGKQNDVFLLGQTKASGSTLIHNANYNTPNSGNFVARFSPNLDSLRWSTVFGTGSGEPNISPTAFMADVCNRVYIAGWGRKFCGYTLNGSTIPWYSTGTWGMTVTSDAYQSTTDGQDFYLMTMADDASQLVYASFFGEPHNSSSAVNGNDHVDGGTSRFDKLGTLYQSVCASCGSTDNFPTTTGAWSNYNCSNNCNNAIFRINLSSDFPVAEVVPPPAGCAPYTVAFHNTGRGSSFHWDFGDGATSASAQPTHTFNNPGIYSVRLIANMTGGCKSADTTFVQVMVMGQQCYWLDTISACPGNPIQIGMRPTLGCTYRWIDGNGHLSDSTIANPSTGHAGTYTLLVSNGICTDTVRQVIILGHASLTIQADTISCSSPLHINASCSGNGVLCHWSSSSNFTDTLNNDLSRSFIDLAMDSSRWLFIHVIDPLGCEETDSIHISFYKIIDDIEKRDVSCPEACDGAIGVVTGPLGLAPFQYAWDQGDWSADSTLTGLCHGYHTMVVRDSNGCRVSNSVFIDQPPSPSINDSLKHVLCHEFCTGEAHILVQGPFPPYTVTWDDNGLVSPDRTQMCPGSYSLTVTDSTGCVFFDTIVILENADIHIEATYIGNTCADDCNGKASALVQGGTPPFSYQWSSGNTGTFAEDLCEGWAVVTATDATGCAVRDSVLVERQHSFDSIDCWSDKTTLFQDESTGLHVTPIPGGVYSWLPTETLTDYNTPNPTATPVVRQTDSVTYYVTVTDSIGCTYTDSIKLYCVNVECGETNISIPNVFTPNGDGKNDKLCISGEWVKEFYIAIFTRWGELVYESTSMNECWDGRHNDKWCMPGVYTFRCKVTCEAGQEGEFKGDITLIK